MRGDRGNSDCCWYEVFVVLERCTDGVDDSSDCECRLDDGEECVVQCREDGGADGGRAEVSEQLC